MENGKIRRVMRDGFRPGGDCTEDSTSPTQQTALLATVYTCMCIQLSLRLYITFTLYGMLVQIGAKIRGVFFFLLYKLESIFSSQKTWPDF